MGSALGDYVHYSRSGYIYRGTSRTGKVFQRPPKFVNTLQKTKNIDKLNSFLVVANGIKNQTSHGELDKILDKNSKEVTKAANEFLLETLTVDLENNKALSQALERLKNAGADVSKLSAGVPFDKLLEYAASKKKSAYYKKNQKTGTFSYNPRQIARAVEILFKNYSELEGDAGAGKIEKLEEEINKLNSNFKKLKKDLKDSSNYRESEGFRYKKIKREFLELPNEKNAKNMKDFVDWLVGEVCLSAAWPAVMNAEGDALEYLLEITALVATMGAENASEQAIIKAIKSISSTEGQERTATVSYNFGNIQGTISKNLELKDDKGNYIISTKIVSDAVQGKIDNKITWKGEEFNISAKNVTFNEEKEKGVFKEFGGKVSLEESNMLSMLLRINGELANHYLNIHSVGNNRYTLSSDWKTRHVHDKAGNNSKGASFPVDQKDIDNEVIKSIFAESLSGSSRRKKTNNNVLVIHNKRDGSFKLFDMSRIIDLTERLQPGGSSTIRKLNLHKYNVWVGGKKGANHNQSDANLRVAKIISQLHQIGITMSFNPLRLIGNY